MKHEQGTRLFANDHARRLHSVHSKRLQVIDRRLIQKAAQRGRAQRLHGRCIEERWPLLQALYLAHAHHVSITLVDKWCWLRGIHTHCRSGAAVAHLRMRPVCIIARVPRLGGCVLVPTRHRCATRERRGSMCLRASRYAGRSARACETRCAGRWRGRDEWRRRRPAGSMLAAGPPCTGSAIDGSAVRNSPVTGRRCPAAGTGRAGTLSTLPQHGQMSGSVRRDGMCARAGAARGVWGGPRRAGALSSPRGPPRARPDAGPRAQMQGQGGWRRDAHTPRASIQRPNSIGAAQHPIRYVRSQYFLALSVPPPWRET